MTIRAVNRRSRQTLAQRRSRTYSAPAPVGGWNVRDSIANMKEEDATLLDNWFPEDNAARVRRGYSEHATGLGGAVEALMTWAFGASQKMFGAANGSIFDVSSSGAVGAAAVSSLNSDRWQWTNFGTSGGNFLYIVNGSDAPRYYNGSSWTTPTITGSGLTASDLIHVNAFKRRLFFIEKDTLSFWYFPVTTISGSITEFDLAPECSLGGYLMAMGTLTHDGGDGLDDYAVFITSRGEVIIYQGTDPGTAADWVKVGTFRIGAPIGRRCLMKLAGDLVVITEDGFAPLKSFLAGGRVSETAAFSDKIRGAVQEAVRQHKNKFGWQPIFYPRGNYVLFNIPIVEGEETHQYVSNSTTRAWCRFTGMNGNCWELFNEDLYFGGDGVVYKADDGLDDDGSDIVADARTAFSFLGARGALKIVHEARPLLISTAAVEGALEINMDYETRFPTSTPTFTEAAGSEWDDAIWDTADWADSDSVRNDWQSVSGFGYAAAVRMRSASQSSNVFWNRTDFLWEPGGLL